MIEEIPIPYISTSEEFDKTIAEVDCAIVWTKRNNHQSHLIAAIANEQPNRKLPIYKIDIDVMKKKVSEYSIKNCPFITVFRNGYVVEAATKMTSLISTQIASRTPREVALQRKKVDLDLTAIENEKSNA